MEPATPLSMELSAFKNQIEKRISATKSNTARSEYGVDILDGSILVPLNLILVKLTSPKAVRGLGHQNLLITLTQPILQVLNRGKTLRGPETSGVEISWKPYLCKIWVSMDHFRLFVGLWCVFAEGFSGLRNVLPGRFSLREEKGRVR